MAKSPTILPVVAGGAALLLLASGKKKKPPSSVATTKTRWGVRINSNCSEVDIVNMKLFQDFLFGAFNELVSADPSLSLLQMTDGLFGDIAPHCSGFPEEPESPAIVELYATIARSVGRFMLEDPRVNIAAEELVDEATLISFMDWYKSWREYPSPDVHEAPSDEVSFSSDYSSYKIGADWYEATIKPFVAMELESNRGEMSFQDYVESRGVLVGAFVKPISELPQGKPSVEDFFDRIEEAIDSALAELK